MVYVVYCLDFAVDGREFVIIVSREMRSFDKFDEAVKIKLR